MKFRRGSEEWTKTARYWMTDDLRFLLWRDGKRRWVVRDISEFERNPWLVKHGFYRTSFSTRREAATRLSDALLLEPPSPRA